MTGDPPWSPYGSNPHQHFGSGTQPYREMGAPPPSAIDQVALGNSIFGNPMDRIAAAFERIAAALEKLAVK